MLKEAICREDNRLAAKLYRKREKQKMQKKKCDQPGFNATQNANKNQWRTNTSHPTPPLRKSNSSGFFGVSKYRKWFEGKFQDGKTIIRTPAHFATAKEAGKAVDKLLHAQGWHNMCNFDVTGKKRKRSSSEEWIKYKKKQTKSKRKE
jgi:hypothetical protein